MDLRKQFFTFVLRFSLCLAVFVFICPPMHAQFERAFGGAAKELGFKTIYSAQLNGFVQIGSTETSFPGMASLSKPANVFLSAITILGAPIGSLGYNLNIWDVDASIIELEQGGYAWTTGGWNVTNGSYDAYLVRTNAAFAPIWTRRLPGLKTDGGTSLIQILSDGSGDIVVAGYSDSFGKACSDGLIARFTLGGVQLWANFYGTPGEDRLFAIREGCEGDLIAVGSSNGLNLGVGSNRNCDLWWLRVQGDGTLVGSTVYYRTFPSLVNERGFSLVNYFDPAIGIEIVTLAGETYDPTGAFGNVFVVQIECNGVPNWGWLYDLAGGEDRAYAIENNLAMDGGSVLVGKMNSLVEPRGDAFAMELPFLGGAPLWANSYGGVNYETGRSVIISPDGFYATGGSTLTYGLGCGDQYYLKFDAIGNTGVRPPNNTPCPKQLEVFDDPGVFYDPIEICVAECQFEEVINLTLVLGGEMTPICDPVVPPPPPDAQSDNTSLAKGRLLTMNANASSAPNPVQRGEALTLQFPAEANQRYSVQVVDLLGKLIFETEGVAIGDQEEIAIGTQEWRQGSYSISLRKGNSVQHLKVIVQD